MKLSKIYKYYRNQELSLDQRFVDSERDANKFHDKLNALNSQKKGMFAILKEASMHLLGNVKIEKYYIEWGILDFTSKEGYAATGNDWERTFSKAYFGRVKFKVEDDKELHIKSKYGDLDVKKLSAQYPKLLEKIPSLETNERQGMCHKLAIGVATSFVKECEVVTGTIWCLHKKEESLHSWTEKEIDGKVYVLDTMFNAIFEKDQYYKFFNVEVIEKIKNTTLREEAPRVVPFLRRNWNYYKLYLSSHEEMMEFVEREEQREKQRKTEREKCPWAVDEEDLFAD